MAGDYLLDTNILVAYFAGEQVVKQNILEANSVHIPSVVLGELFFGARKSTHIEENLKRVQRLLEWTLIPAFNSNTASLYGLIKSALRAKGRPIPDNDLWIAAVAKQHGLTLITRDKHFSEIVDLEVQSW